MAKYVVGEYIYDVRKQRGYTQEELAEGICTTGTLSKIENGSRMPSVRIYEGLMQRLGEPASLFSVYVGKREMLADHLCRKVLAMLARNDLKDLDFVLKEYGDVIRECNMEESRIMRCMKAVCHTMLDRPPRQVLEELFEILQVQLPVKPEDRLLDKRRLLTFDEIILWNNVAIQYKRMGQTGRALKIWRRLQEYLDEKEIDGEEKAKLYPMVSYNLAGIYFQEHIHTKVVRHSEEGIRSCVEFGKLFPLPYLLYRKGQGLFALGETDEAERYVRQAQALLGILKKSPDEWIEEMAASL